MAIFRKRVKPLVLESAEQLDDLARSGLPVLVDFFQTNCAPCRVMDGIVNELAQEFEGTAHVVKANLAQVPVVFSQFKIKSTPTLMVLTSKDGANQVTQRWRASGLVKKDLLIRTLESAGAVRP